MIYTISIIVLVLIFTTATITPINMGILAFAASFIVGAWISDIPIDDIFDAFPTSIFLIVAGITLLFAIAKANGTVDLVVGACLRLVKGRRWAVLWMMFALSGLLMALGSPMAVGMLAPIAMPLAAKNNIKPLLMGMIISHGALACAFSPVNIYGAFVNGLMSSTGLPANPVAIFFIPFALNLAIALILFAVLGRDLVGKNSRMVGRTEVLGSDEGGASSSSSIDPKQGGRTTLTDPEIGLTEAVLSETRVPMNRYRALTLFGIAVLVLGSVSFGIDVGVTAVCVSAALLLISPKSHPLIINDIAWPAVVLVIGMLTYMSVLTMNGTLDFLGDAAAALGSPLATALILCYSVGVISAFGSSIGTLGIALPLAAPLLAAGDVGAVGFIAALAFSATVVDVSPFSTNGVLVLANAVVDDRPKFQRTMLFYCGTIVLLAPLAAWLIVIVPTSI